MQRGLYFLAGAFIFYSVLASANDFSFIGPTELQDTFLPAQVRYQSYPESPRVLKTNDWSINATADWTADLARTDTYLFDGETVTATLKIRHSLVKRFEAGVDIPYADRVNGSLDEFIELVETKLNQKVLARYQLPRDTYQAFVGTTNQAELLLRKGHGFRDITLRGKYQFLDVEDEQWLDASATMTLAVPTGNSTFGGEGFAPALGLHFQKPLEHFNFFAGGVATYYTDDVEEQFQLQRWRGMGYGGLEIRPWKYFGIVLEYQIYSALALDHSPLDEVSQYWSFSPLRLYFPHAIGEVTMVENSFFGLLENRNGSDVVFKFSVTGRF